MTRLPKRVYWHRRIAVMLCAAGIGALVLVPAFRVSVLALLLIPTAWPRVSPVLFWSSLGLAVAGAVVHYYYVRKARVKNPQ